MLISSKIQCFQLQRFFIEGLDPVLDAKRQVAGDTIPVHVLVAFELLELDDVSQRLVRDESVSA